MLLPPIISTVSHDAFSCTLNIYIHPELDYFRGHFPELPILPGVVQLDWAVKLGKQFLGVSGNFASMENLKFLAVITPDNHIRLKLDWMPEQMMLTFSYENDGKKFSHGKLLLSA